VDADHAVARAARALRVAVDQHVVRQVQGSTQVSPRCGRHAGRFRLLLPPLLQDHHDRTPMGDALPQTLLIR
jgi:hypothetical protein